MGVVIIVSDGGLVLVVARRPRHASGGVRGVGLLPAHGVAGGVGRVVDGDDWVLGVGVGF